LLVIVFVAGSAATWIAGIVLSKSTDSLDRRFGLGEALGGLILLAIAGTLPEIAIVASASVAGHLDLAVGNLIGGIAIQTLVLVVLDAAAGPERPLSYLVGSLTPVLEALIVVVCLATVLGGAALPASTSVGGVSPTSIAVVLLWVGGVWVVNRVRMRTDWKSRCPEHGRAAVTSARPTRTSGARS
jgi:cation:H+ antiporter